MASTVEEQKRQDDQPCGGDAASVWSPDHGFKGSDRDPECPLRPWLVDNFLLVHN